MKQTLIIDKSKSRNEIIADIVYNAKTECGYNKDILYRSLKGIEKYPEYDFQRILQKVIKNEIPEVKEIIFCKADTFRQYIEKESKT